MEGLLARAPKFSEAVSPPWFSSVWQMLSLLRRALLQSLNHGFLQADPRQGCRYVGAANSLCLPAQPSTGTVSYCKLDGRVVCRVVILIHLPKILIAEGGVLWLLAGIYAVCAHNALRHRRQHRRERTRCSRQHGPYPAARQ